MAQPSCLFYARSLHGWCVFQSLHEIASPAAHTEKMVVLGGEVLSAKRLPEGTLIEVLQLPTERLQPVLTAHQSEGRFLAFN